MRRGSLGRKASLYWLVKALSPLDDILTQAPPRPQGSSLALQGLTSGASAGTWSQLLTTQLCLRILNVICGKSRVFGRRGLQRGSKSICFCTWPR